MKRSIRSLLILLLLAFFASSAWSITLQIPTRPTAFPLVAEPYQDEGIVVAWGNNPDGQTNIPDGLTNVVLVAAGAGHNFAIKSDGTLVAWGSNSFGQTSIPAGLTNIVQVASSWNVTALKSDGTLVAWGKNPYQPTNVPTGLTNIVQVAVGGNHNIALKSDGTLIAWGKSIYQPYTLPTGLTNIVQVATGGGTDVALKSDGSLVAWGDQTYGIPAGLTNIVQVEAGDQHIIALKSDGTLIAWGNNSYGQISIPAGLTNIVQVAAGAMHNIALKSDGTLIAWGNNSYGQTSIPAGLTNIIQVAACNVHSIALKKRIPQLIASFPPIPTSTHGISFSVTPPTSSSSLPVAISIQSGPAMISGNTITPTGAGTVVLAANQSGNSHYLPALEVTTSFTVNRGNQTISFQGILGQVVGRVFSVALPISSSALPVSISIKSGPATISGNTITPTGTGTVVLSANQSGDENWNPSAEVTTSFVVKSYGQTIRAFPAVPDKFYGALPFLITLPTATSKLPVVVTVKSGPARISNNNLTITGAGNVVLAANQAGNASYAPAAEVTTSFTVYPANQTIKIPPKLKPPVQAGVYPLPSFNSTAGLPVSFYVMSGPAYIDGNNYVVTGPGRVWVAVDQVGNSNYNAARQVSFYFDVGKSTQSISTNGIIIPSIPGTYALPSISSSAGLPVDVILVSGPVRDAGYPYYTITGPGMVTVRLKQAGNDYYKPAADLVVPFRVKLYDQAIYPFRSIQAQTYGAAPFVVPAPLASSGLPVTVSVKSGPARISKGLLTITGRGVVTLSANQAGNVNYNAAAPATTSFSVN